MSRKEGNAERGRGVDCCRGKRGSVRGADRSESDVEGQCGSVCDLHRGIFAADNGLHVDAGLRNI